jgi:hypothetical protein
MYQRTPTNVSASLRRQLELLRRCIKVHPLIPVHLLHSALKLHQGCLRAHPRTPVRLTPLTNSEFENNESKECSDTWCNRRCIKVHPPTSAPPCGSNWSCCIRVYECIRVHPRTPVRLTTTPPSDVITKLGGFSSIY